MKKQQRFIHLKIKNIDSLILPIKADGNEALSAPFFYEVTILSTEDQLTSADLLYRSCCLYLGYKQVKVLHAMLTQIKALGRHQSGLWQYKLCLQPEFIKLHHTPVKRSYCKLSIPEIIQTTFSEYRLEHYDTSKLTSHYDKIDCCIQYNETAFEFICRLMQQANISYYFTHSENRHCLVLDDSGQAHSNYPQRLTTTKHNNVLNWKQIQTLSPAESATAKPLNHHNRTSHYVFSSQCFLFNPGMSVTCDFAAESSLLITKITHHAVDNSLLQINADRQNHYKNTVEVYPPSHYPPLTATSIKPFITHLQTARVIKIKQQCVQVIFDWQTEDQYQRSCWIPCQQAWAGSARGCSFIPNVGQPVVVQFINGQANQPLVIAGMTATSHQPPHEFPEQQQLSSITSEHGQQILFDDHPQQKKLVIKTKRDMCLTIKKHYQQNSLNNANNQIGKNHVVDVKQSYAITAKSTITLSCKSSRVLINEQGITLQSDRIEFI